MLLILHVLLDELNEFLDLVDVLLLGLVLQIILALPEVHF